MNSNKLKNQKMKRIAVAILAISFFLAPSAVSFAGQNPAGSSYDSVDPFIGTDKGGNTFPGATLPFGMIQWSPDTAPDGWYSYDGKSIRGFSLTHLSGAGCPVYADVPILPWTSDVKENPAQQPKTYTLPFSHTDSAGNKLEEAHPGYYSIRFPSGIRVELTTTKRTGIGRFTFPEGVSKTLIFNAGGSAMVDDPKRTTDNDSVELLDQNTLVGTVHSGGFCYIPGDYTIYFVAKLKTPYASAGTWDDKSVTPNGTKASGHKAGAYVTFAPGTPSEVLLKVAVSFVSIDNAISNLAAEDPGWDFNDVREKARREWNERFDRVRVEGGTKDQRTMFYTGLYHMLIAPNIFSDVNGDYTGFDSKVRRLGGSAQYANYSDWDIYRGVVQLHAWLFPKESSDMMESLVRDAEQMGSLPRWPVANDVTEVMGGDSPTILLSSAYAFGARSFDAKSALAFSLKSAASTETGPHGYQERRFGDEYRTLGYVPSELDVISVSRTLEYANSDFAISQFAKELGDEQDSQRLLRSSQNWKNVFDPSIGWMHPRLRDGKFIDGFDLVKLLPYRYPGDTASQLGFEEGNTFQYTWMVPFDYAGLFRLMGGRDEAIKKLDPFFTELRAWGKPYFNVENEPDFVAPYAYDFAGAPWKTQQVMSRVVSQTFSTAPSGTPGNDDLGATSGVYVWGALGVFPAIPGLGGLTIGTPMFDRATIRLGNDATFDISRSGKGIYVHSASLDGKPYDSTWISLDQLKKSGSTLHFNMAETPNRNWATSPGSLPPSFGEDSTNH